MKDWNIKGVRKEFIKEFIEEFEYVLDGKFPLSRCITFRVLNKEEGEQLCKVLHKFGFIWEYGFGLLKNKTLCYDPCDRSYNNAYYICIQVIYGSRPNIIQRERGIFVDTKEKYDKKICIEFKDAIKGFINIRKRMKVNKIAED